MFKEIKEIREIDEIRKDNEKRKKEYEKLISSEEHLRALKKFEMLMGDDTTDKREEK